MSYWLICTLACSKYSSHSCRRNGDSFISAVNRPYSPPLFLERLLRIHDVALPQTISIMLSLPLHHPFQKFSKAGRKPDRGVSIHGNSSMTTNSALDAAKSGCSGNKKRGRAGQDCKFAVTSPVCPNLRRRFSVCVREVISLSSCRSICRCREAGRQGF